MSAISDLISDINTWIDNYAPNAFLNKRLNNILLRLVGLLQTLIGGPTIAMPAVTIVTSANFTTATDCPIAALNGLNITVLWVDPPKPLILGTDFSALAGGGFRVLIPGFDKSLGTYTFWVFTTL